MKVTNFLNWDSAPAVLGVNRSGSTVGYAFNPDTGAWFNVSPADLSTNGRVMSREHFAAVFPTADLALLDDLNPKSGTEPGLFAGIPESRLAGIIAQGVAMAELDLASRQQPSNTPEQKPEVNRAPAPTMPAGTITVTKEQLEKFSKPALPFPVIFPTKD